VRQDRPPRAARGPAVVDQQRGIGFGHRGSPVRLRRRSPAGKIRIVDPHEAGDARQAGADLADPVEEFPREEERLHVRVFENGGQFAGDQQVVQRHEGRSRRGDREEGLEVQNRVLREDRDAVPFSDARRAKHAGVAEDPVAQVPVRDLLLPLDEGDPERAGAGVMFEDVLDEQGMPPGSAGCG